MMKTIALTLLAAALGFAQSQSSASNTTTPEKSSAQNKKPAPSKPSAAKPSPAKPSADQAARAQTQTQSIPAGAEQVEPNLYRSTDASGKTWMYRQTPFGISKWEEGSNPAPATAAKSDPVAVTELGDTVRFEKKTPFGGSSWVRKKSELNDEEKALLAGANGSSQASSAVPNQAAPRPADKTKEDK